MSISPTGAHLAVWEGPLEYKLHILSLTGEVLGTFSPGPDPGFGIRSVAWHPTGMFLAVAGWDDKVRSATEILFSYSFHADPYPGELSLVKSHVLGNWSAYASHCGTLHLTIVLLSLHLKHCRMFGENLLTGLKLPKGAVSSHVSGVLYDDLLLSLTSLCR